MAFDGIILKSIVSELNTFLMNGKINKVFNPTKNEVILGIYANGKNYALNICIDASNYRIHLTTKQKPNPINASNFCMLLRKYLIGMRIKEIHSYGLERIVKIDLEGYNELNDFITRKLVVELMGKHSNIILLNENNRIIDSLRHTDTFSNSLRNILPSHVYEYPENNKKSFSDIKNFNEFYSLFGNLENTELNSVVTIIINTFTGFSKLFVKNCIDVLQLSNPLNIEDFERLYEYINNIINNIGTCSLSPITYELNNKLDYTVTLDAHEKDLYFNFFIDDFYFNKETIDNFKNYRNTVLKLLLNYLTKYRKRLLNINDKLKECDNMDVYRIYGELITANLYRLSKENTSSITLENYYDNNKPITISLDKSITPAINAKKFFKKYNKLKNALEIVNKQKIETSKEINYIESIIYELETAKTISDIDDIYSEILENLDIGKSIKNTKNKDISFNPKKYEIDGFIVFVGKNNKQNDYLTTKFASKTDIWFHTKEIHGSHVILKNNGQEITNDILIKCAKLAAKNSKAKQSSNVPVDYTLIKFVKKPSGAKPGMVIYTNNKTLYVTP